MPSNPGPERLTEGLKEIVISKRVLESATGSIRASCGSRFALSQSIFQRIHSRHGADRLPQLGVVVG